MLDICYEYSDFMYLLWCAVNHHIPKKEYVRSANAEKLLRLSVSHKLTVLVNEAVQRSDDGLFSEEDKKQFKIAALRAIRVNLLLDYETKQILSLLEDNQLTYMPLKGYVLKKYYPRTDMRQMGDIDILMDAKDADKIHEIMLTSGYQCRSFNKTHHDTYFKTPFYLYEFHRNLFLGAEKKWEAYYQDISHYLVHKSGHEYQLAPEEMYIYIVLHSLKHFLDRGTGIRFLTDIYFYLRSVKVDMEYIDHKMKKLGVQSYERLFRNLAFKLLSAESEGHDWKLSKAESKALYELQRSGAYGSSEVAVTHRMERLVTGKHGKMAKPVYVFKRIFIIPEIYKIRYPFLYKSFVLRIVIVVIRAMNAMKNKQKLIAGELKALKKHTAADSSEEDGNIDA